MIRVKATREGEVGKPTATGDVITRRLPFVALPSLNALGRFVRLVNPLNDKRALAFVDDVGPWEEHDDQYVFQRATAPGSGEPEAVRPRAESGIDSRGRVTNGAGIDLSENVWRQLQMTDNMPLLWEFIQP